MTANQQYILSVWNEIEAEESYISTERLIEMVCQRTGKDLDAVLDALEAEAEARPRSN